MKAKLKNGIEIELNFNRNLYYTKFSQNDIKEIISSLEVGRENEQVALLICALLEINFDKKNVEFILEIGFDAEELDKILDFLVQNFLLDIEKIESVIKNERFS